MFERNSILGDILDKHLSWKPHILSFSRKISKSIGIIYRSLQVKFLPSSKTVYFTLLCVSVWGSTCHSKTYHYPAKEDNQNNIQSIVRFS